jgi:hypothetical protein
MSDENKPIQDEELDKVSGGVASHPGPIAPPIDPIRPIPGGAAPPTHPGGGVVKDPIEPVKRSTAAG